MSRTRLIIMAMSLLVCRWRLRLAARSAWRLWMGKRWGVPQLEADDAGVEEELEETGLFEVTVITAPPSDGDFSNFKPD